MTFEEQANVRIIFELKENDMVRILDIQNLLSEEEIKNLPLGEEIWKKYIYKAELDMPMSHMFRKDVGLKKECHVNKWNMWCVNGLPELKETIHILKIDDVMKYNDLVKFTEKYLQILAWRFSKIRKEVYNVVEDRYRGSRGYIVLKNIEKLSKKEQEEIMDREWEKYIIERNV